MAFSLGILLFILGAAGFCVTCWRGIKNSSNITNPFPELPDDAFRKCADMVKKRYTFLFICNLVILISLLLLFAASAGGVKNTNLLVVFGLFVIFGLFVAVFFLALSTFERRKADEILEAHKHNWKDLTHSIAAHNTKLPSNK
ncbi:MAG: hypothetical protein D4R73_03375 [Deltaproteobacteria bacterium]|nr:MAG: hypothetical protein D4R73_03375 [Deltaproteobacteria bacterium]